MSGDVIPALSVRGVSKRFGTTCALVDVSVTVMPGQVHALLGHNGSGKSTLVKVLAGYHPPDEGSVAIGDRVLQHPVTLASLRACGASVLHQDVGLVPTISVLENLCVGNFQTGVAGRIRWHDERERCRLFLASFGLSLDPDMPVRRLSASERAIVGLVRAFQDAGAHGAPRLLVLDEPTASLDRSETDQLFAAIRATAERGCGVLLVTHCLPDVLAAADHVSVLRDGAVVACRPVEGLDEGMLAELIVGRATNTARVRAFYTRAAAPNMDFDPAPHSSTVDKPSTEVLLRVEHLRGTTLRDASLVVRRGEIVALTGLIGAGHEEVPSLVFGAQVAKAGQVNVRDRPYPHRSPAASRRYGLAFVSQDRLSCGGILGASLAENVSLPILSRLTGPFGWIRARREMTEVEAILSRFQVRAAGPSAKFGVLSGGNQQKVLVGRWVASTPRVLLMCEPTSGVDIGAVDEIGRILHEFAEDGGAVLFSSVQYEDVVKLADRALIFVDGAISTELSGDGLTRHQLHACSLAQRVG